MIKKMGQIYRIMKYFKIICTIKFILQNSWIFLLAYNSYAGVYIVIFIYVLQYVLVRLPPIILSPPSPYF
jgi:hypothetical protein